MNKENKVEIARSFSYKLNIGNYQTVDFFCSEKSEVPESQAVEKSEELYDFCKEEVRKSIVNFKVELIKVEPTKLISEWDLRNMKSDVETEEAESDIVGQQFREGNK